MSSSCGILAIVTRRPPPLQKNRRLARETSRMEESAADPNAPSCKVCHVSLRESADYFKSMKRTGSALKKRKLNPPKKRKSIDAYRNVTAQNAWLLSNVYDSRGNYIFCQECIRYYLGVGKQRMSRLRQIKARFLLYL